MSPRNYSLLAFLLACGAPAGEPSSGASQAEVAAATPKIRFTGDFQVIPSGRLVSGRKAEIDYDAARVRNCTGDINGGPGWTTTGFYRVNGGNVQSFWAAGHSPTGNTNPPLIDLPAEVGNADLEMWFQTTSVFGCVEWDSDYGRNFHLGLAPPPEAPGWIGNPTSLLARGTCSGKPCESDRHALAPSGVTFDTWVRERAEFAELAFEVYKQGTTDWNDPDTWKKLDVEGFVRFSPGAFAKSYVNIEDHVGNNVRYGFGLRPFDPFEGPAPQSKADCPAAPIRLVNGMLEADADVYFTINGVELRPSPTGTWPVKFIENPGPFSICAN